MSAAKVSAAESEAAEREIDSLLAGLLEEDADMDRLEQRARFLDDDGDDSDLLAASSRRRAA